MGLQIIIETVFDPKRRQRMRRVSLVERMLRTSQSFAIR
jgi:polar amino acid transport system permease protein